MRHLLALFGVILGAQVATAAPAQVMLIRHAEKPDQGSDLSPRGYKRAQALVGFFTTNPEMLQYGTPVAIYAPGDRSGRAVKTVQPLANALSLSVDTTFGKAQVRELVNQVMTDHRYDGRMVLICWTHGEIPQIATELGLTSVPTWDGNVFDRVWEFDFSEGKLTGFVNIPQHLLSGDSDQ